VSIAFSELEQPHDRYLPRSSQWDPYDPYDLVTMTAVTGGFKANQDQR
jgi:hypothetical protein